jgi:hypothetical protein
MGKERIAMTGDSLNFNLGRILQTVEPDLSGIIVSPSGEVISALVQEPVSSANAPAPSVPVSVEARQNT